MTSSPLQVFPGSSAGGQAVIIGLTNMVFHRVGYGPDRLGRTPCGASDRFDPHGRHTVGHRGDLFRAEAPRASPVDPDCIRCPLRILARGSCVGPPRRGISQRSPFARAKPGQPHWLIINAIIVGIFPHAGSSYGCGVLSRDRA